MNLIISEADVGPSAYGRMVRDGVLESLCARRGLPRDLPSGPGFRALAIAHRVPAQATVTGLAGLWVLAGGKSPTTLDVWLPAHQHRRSTSSSREAPRLVCHSQPPGRTAPTAVGPIRVAGPSSCVVEALLINPTAALPHAFNALLLGHSAVSHVERELALVPRTDARRPAALAAWQVAAAALSAAQQARRQDS